MLFIQIKLNTSHTSQHFHTQTVLLCSLCKERLIAYHGVSWRWLGVCFSANSHLSGSSVTVRCSTVWRERGRSGKLRRAIKKKRELGEAHNCDHQIKPCEAWKSPILWKPMGSYVVKLAAECGSCRRQTWLFNKYKLPDCPNQIIRTQDIWGFQQF